MQIDFLELTVQAAQVRLAYMHRAGAGVPLVCLHGFGSTKEDYGDLALRPDWDGRPLLLLDAPGFGASTVDRPEQLSIPFLVAVTLAACDALGLPRFHLSGHSMGGLTALMLAHTHPDRVASLISIEGNVAPEDCFLSRQILQHPAGDAQAFFDGFRARVRGRSEYGSALYAAGLGAKVQPTSCAPIFHSMVAISDGEPLLDWLAALPCPRLFIHGAQNRHLSYLPRLPALGVAVAEIAHAGHFPMYTNPPALWDQMAAFLAQAEAAPLQEA